MEQRVRLGFAATLAFFCELFMFGLLITAGHLLFSGWTGWLIGMVFMAVAVWVWARWMAPTSQLRLDRRRRLLAQIILFAVVGGLVMTAGLAWWGLIFFVLACAVFTMYPE